MFNLEKLDIDIHSLKEESYEASYMLGDDYFEALDEADIRHGEVSVHAAIQKVAATQYDLLLNVEGSVTVQCDRCLDDMQQGISGSERFIVKLGIGNDADDDSVYVDEQEGILSLSWLIYETIVLALPIKHVHAPGKCNAAMTEKLMELSATRSGDGEDEEQAVDPRWAALSQLKS